MPLTSFIYAQEYNEIDCGGADFRRQGKRSSR
jgi:hypothetical protein